MTTDVGSEDGGEVLPDAHGPGSALELLSVTGYDQERQSTEETIRSNGPAAVTGRIVLVAAVVGLFFLFASGGSGGPDGGDAPGGEGDLAGLDANPIADTTASDGEPSASQGVAITNFRPWPDPPEDHDPHVAGRPGPQEPVADGLIGRTLVYVNGRGRPTVIDLSTGDQRELEIAGPRDRDTFLVEFGKVVADPGSDAVLPKSQGRAFRFTVERTAIPGAGPNTVQDDAISLSGPTLCLDEGGCAGAALLTGTFGDDQNRVSSMHGADSVLQAIADAVGSDRWRMEDRWTFFSLDSGSESEAQWRVPTPMTSTIVWLIEQLPPEPLTG